VNIVIQKPASGGKVKAIASKSQAHRMLICASLADKDTYIECGETSDDIEATVKCLENLGARILRDGSGFNVGPIAFPISKNDAITQHCGESGSTLRFMLPVCCALGVHANFFMNGRLSERPMTPLLDELTAHGCKIAKGDDDDAGQLVEDVPAQRCCGDRMSPGCDEGAPPQSDSCDVLRCQGKLSDGVYELPGNVSSQFVSGLFFALSLLDDDSVVSVVGRVESRPYIAMTLDALNTFGVSISRFTANPDKGAAYRIRGAQRYRSPGTVRIEGDWSNAAFWLCAGAIGGDGVTCTGLNLGSTQGDMSIMRLLERFGARVAYEGGSVTVSPSKLRGIQIDAIDTPDLVPALSVVASVAEGETTIYNAGRLRSKESDRLQAVTQALEILGADIKETQDGLTIKGKSRLRGGTVSSCGDHRIAMMAAIASIVCENTVTINDANAVNKSYPGFFRDFEALGGRICEC